MGDVVSSHLDEAKRDIISARTEKVMGEFGRLYEQQFAVALFNKVRFDIEGGGGPQSQLLHRKIPLENKSIFSGSLFQNIEENKKWKNRFFFVPDSYNINYYDNKSSFEKRLHTKGTINCAGYKVLTSLEEYLDLISNSLPDVKAKVGSAPFLKFPYQFPLILWHPYARHYYFCVATEKEQQKWHAVLQDCVRHSNDGLCEEHKVQTPAFTDAVRLYRQALGSYGTWDMMCGVPSQILSNLVMEGLLPELRELISPRLKGKLHERQRTWMLISDVVYSMVQTQCQAQYGAVVHTCEAARSSLEASIRTDMDQIITSKEHVSNKIKAMVLPKAEKLLKVSIQPYISSILDALMEPTSRGFSEVRDVFFKELVEMSKNSLNNGTKDTVAQHMEKISMLAFHPVKMQSCYEKVEQLSLEGLQQRFDVSSPSVFIQRAQILMRKQMDDAVYTFEQILHQSLESQGAEDLCKTIQRCQDRVIKKFDYDSSTVRKRFFREALLQIFIPYMLKQLGPSCSSELPRFQELIFEDFSRFLLVENMFEEVVLHSVMKDIMMAVKEAAVQRRHNLYRDSIVLSNSDPSLHLLGENPSIDWAETYGAAQGEAGEPGEETNGNSAESKRRRMKQVVSMIQEEGSAFFPGESCLEVPSVAVIVEENADEESSADPKLSNGSTPKEGAVKAERHIQVVSKVDPAVGAVPAQRGEEKGESSQPVVVKEEAPSAPPPLNEAAETTPGPVLKESCEYTPLKPESSAESTTDQKEQVGQPVEEESEEAEPLQNKESEEAEPPRNKESEEAEPPRNKESEEAEPPQKKEESKEAEPPHNKEESEEAEPLRNKESEEAEPPHNKEESEEAEPPRNKEESAPAPLSEDLPSEAAPENPPEPATDSAPLPHDDSGFQSPTNEEVKQEEASSYRPHP